MPTPKKLFAYDITFSGNPLDRKDQHRPRVKKALWPPQDRSARSIVLTRDHILTHSTGRLAWATPQDLACFTIHTTVFLGMNGTRPCFASLINEPESLEKLPDVLIKQSPELSATRFTQEQSLTVLLKSGHGDLGIFAQAKSMLNWHRSHPRCAQCGSLTDLAAAGYERHCPACGARHFPRTDPVVIMLPLFNDKILIGRGPNLPSGVFSALAGFIEPGESLEEAVSRELDEEANVAIDHVHYWGSQPWPWPSSLMLGCFARATSCTVKPDGIEVTHLHWITKDDLRLIKSGQRTDILIPPETTIARNLMEHWLKSPSIF